MADIVTIRLPRSLADRIDAVRVATISREAWVRQVITREVDRADSNRRALGAAVGEAASEAGFIAETPPVAPPRASGIDWEGEMARRKAKR